MSICWSILAEPQELYLHSTLTHNKPRLEPDVLLQKEPEKAETKATKTVRYKTSEEVFHS